MCRCSSFAIACRVTANTNSVRTPNLVVLDLAILTKKHPSAETNP